jgi:hypothetical protein
MWTDAVVVVTFGQPDGRPHRLLVAMSSHKSGFHLSQIVPGVLAAVTAAALGSTLGVAGTILGAAVGSLVTTVAAELYVRSLDRVRTRVGGTAEKPDKTVDKPGEEVEGKTPKPSRRVRWQLLAGASLLAFVLGMVVITGVEWVRGSPLSGDGKTTIGGVLQPPHTSPNKPSPSSPKHDDPPSPTTTVTTTAPPPPSSSTSGSPTPSSTPSTTGSSSGQPTSSTTDPVQSTPSSPPSTTP